MPPADIAGDAVERFERFADEIKRLMGVTDLDADEFVDGYSIDSASDAFDEGMSAVEYAAGRRPASMNTNPRWVAAAKEASVPKPVHVIVLPSGRRVRVGEYVRSWRALKAAPPEALVSHWDHFPTKACDVLQQLSAGVHDRINRRGGLTLTEDEEQEYQNYRHDARVVNEYVRERIVRSGRNVLRSALCKARYPHIDNPVDQYSGGSW